MSKKWTYHRSHSFEHEGRKVTFITQLYKVGVYGIINGNPAMQGSFTPSGLVTMERLLKKDAEKGEITNLEFGIPITVTKDENGLLMEVES